MSIKLYKVGGCVRDQLLGLKPKDIDYSVEAPSFEAMLEYIKSTHKEVFLVKPEYLTVRALTHDREAVDYVLCRRDGTYGDQRRPDYVEPGSIYDDLARRDFSMNSMAIDEDGKLIDPHHGQQDLTMRIIRCVGKTADRFNEDPLRLLRAMRFSITKNLMLNHEITACFNQPEIWVFKLNTISTERIREELTKCFTHSTPKTLMFFRTIPHVWSETVFNQIWLNPTVKFKRTDLPY